MAFAELAAGGVGKAGKFVIFEGEIAIGAHDFGAGEVGVVGGEDGLYVRKSIDELYNFFRQIECVLN